LFTASLFNSTLNPEAFTPDKRNRKLRNETSVTMFYRGNKTWVRVWVLIN